MGDTESRRLERAREVHAVEHEEDMLRRAPLFEALDDD
jgi:hypothetical protein